MGLLDSLSAHATRPFAQTFITPLYILHGILQPSSRQPLVLSTRHNDASMEMVIVVVVVMETVVVTMIMTVVTVLVMSLAIVVEIKGRLSGPLVGRLGRSFSLEFLVLLRSKLAVPLHIIRQ